MKKSLQAVRNFRFQSSNAGQNIFDGFGRLILVEIARHGDFIADFSFLVDNFGVGGVGQNLALKIFVNVFSHGDVFCVAEVWSFDGDFIKAEIFRAENFAVAVDAVFVAINGIVLELGISLNDKAAAVVGYVIAFGADTFSARLVAVACVD